MTSKTAFPSKFFFKLIEANQCAKRSMSEPTRTQDVPHWIPNKMNNYQKGKNLELQNIRENPRSNGATPRKSSTQPTTGPTRTYHRHRPSRKEQQQGCPA